MTPDAFSVSPTDNLQTILQKLDTAIHSEDATIEAAKARRSELVLLRSSLERLPTEIEPTAPQLPATATANGAEPTTPVSKKMPASKPSASKATNETGSNGAAALKPTATASESTATESAPRTIPKRTGPKKTSANATAPTSPSRSPKSKSAAKTTSTSTASVKGFNLGRYQEDLQQSAGITRGMPLQEALQKLLESLPDQAFTTPEIVRRLYGMLKPAAHAEVLPHVQSALTYGLRRGLWGRGGSKNVTKYRHQSAQGQG